VNLEVIRKRYLQDNFSRRLGALAANLARIASFLQIRLAVWRYRLDQGKNGFETLAQEFKQHSEEWLQASGLLLS